MAAPTHSAVVLKAFDAASPLAGTELGQRPTRDPGEGEVQVRMTLAPINPSDVFSLMGVYPAMGRDLPAVPGFDGVGVVTKVGPGVSGLTAGQRVAGCPWAAGAGEGSWQQVCVVSASSVVPVPDGVSDEAAAQFYINPVTVLGLVEASGVKKGGHLVVTAAGSTLSKMLLSYAKSQGIAAIGTVRREEQRAEVLAAGAAHAVCTETEDVAERVKELTGGEGADAAVDSVAGALSEKLGAALKPGGRVVIYGLMGGVNFTGDALSCLFRGVSYGGFWLEPWLKSMTKDARSAVMARTMDALASGVMRPETGKVFGLAEYRAAVEESLKVARGGKVLLRLN